MSLLTSSLAIAQTAAPTTTTAAASKVEMQSLGQAGFRIVSPGGKLIVVDPWIKGGPKAPANYKADLAALGKIDILRKDPSLLSRIGEHGQGQAL